MSQGAVAVMLAYAIFQQWALWARVTFDLWRVTLTQARNTSWDKVPTRLAACMASYNAFHTDILNERTHNIDLSSLNLERHWKLRKNLHKFLFWRPYARPDVTNWRTAWAICCFRGLWTVQVLCVPPRLDTVSLSHHSLVMAHFMRLLFKAWTLASWSQLAYLVNKYENFSDLPYSDQHPRRALDTHWWTEYNAQRCIL